MSYKAEVIADLSGKWCSNALAFASQQEALEYGLDLGARWTAVREVRVAESDEPVSAQWVGGIERVRHIRG